MDEDGPFAHDITLDECRAAIAEHREFRETRKGSTSVINYDFCHGATFADPEAPGVDAAERRRLRVLRECRGIMFDTASGVLIARRLHKFLNLDQCDESSSARLSLAGEPHVVVVKVDGCMVSGVQLDGEWLLVSKNGPTDLSRTVADTLALQPQKRWQTLCGEWAARDHTVTFEWVSPDNRIVLHYAEPDLVLTAIRHNRTGQYVRHADMAAAAQRCGLTCAALLWDSDSQGPLVLGDLLARIRGATELEGCVLKLERTGRWYKIKSDWYFAQSKSHILLPPREFQVWAAVLGGAMDDTLPRLTVEVRARVEAFSARLFAALQTRADEWAVELERDTPRATLAGSAWARWVRAAPLSPLRRALYYRAHAGPPLLPLLLPLAARNCTKHHFADMRAELGLQSVAFYGSE